MSTSNRYPLVGLDMGMILVVGRFYAPDAIKGRVMALDTGSSLTVMTNQAIQEMGMDPEHPSEYRQTFVWGNSHQSPILIVPRVRVFGKEVCDLEIACGDLPCLGCFLSTCSQDRWCVGTELSAPF